MASNCNDQISVPTTDNTLLDCPEFIYTDCIVHPESIPELSLTENSNLTQIIENLVLALVEANARIETLENQ